MPNVEWSWVEKIGLLVGPFNEKVHELDDKKWISWNEWSFGWSLWLNLKLVEWLTKHNSSNFWVI